MPTVTYKGPSLYKWQKDVVNEICNKVGTNKVVCCKAHRQAGKSFVCEGVLLDYALNHRCTKSAMISPTLNQSRNVFKEIVDAVYESGVIKKKNEQLLEIEFINRSKLFFRSAEMGDALRGYHVNGILILDEASYLTDDIAQLVLPWRQVAKAPMLVVSTPKLKTGLFYKYYSMGLAHEENTVTIDWNEYDTSALLDEDTKKAYKKILTANQYKCEILGEFLDMDGMVFTNLQNCVGTAGDSRFLYGGIDWGTGKGEDYTSLTIFNEKGEMVYMDCFNDLGTFPQVERLIKDIEPYKGQIRLIQAENNSIGNPMTDLLTKTLTDRNERELVNRIKPFVTSNESKARIVAQLQVALENQQVKLLDDKMLLNELAAYEATYNSKTGKVSYNGAQGIHDDCVISTMIAYDSLKASTASGAYSLGYYAKAIRV